MPKQAWYADGLRFTCTQCGKCCRSHGGYTFVYLDSGDIERLAGHFALSRRSFLYRYTDREDFGRTLKWEDDQCIFLTEQGCSVYEARPTQCRTWPFWTETLDKKWIWDQDVVPFCPGVSAEDARLYPLTEIRQLMAGEGETGTP